MPADEEDVTLQNPSLAALSNLVSGTLANWHDDSALPTLPVILSFERYHQEAPLSETKHLELVGLFLSSLKGIAVLLALIKQGFTLTAPKSQDALLRQTIKAVAANVVRVEQEALPDFFSLLGDELMGVINVNAIPQSLQQFQQLLHATFLLIFIQKYYLNQAEQVEKCLNDCWSTLQSMVVKGHHLWAKACLPLLTACGFSLTKKDVVANLQPPVDANVFTVPQYFRFVLEAYQAELDNSPSAYYAIAASLTLNAWEADFSWDKVAMRRALRKQYQSACQINTDIASQRKNKLITYSGHFFLQMACIVASYYQQYDFINTLAQWSTTLPSFAANFNQQQIRAEIAGQIDPLWEPSISAIIDQFWSSGFADNFLPYLEAEFAHFASQKASSSCPPPFFQYMQDPIKLFANVFPNETAYQQWLALPKSDQNFHKTLHHLLLKLEQDNGYNLTHKEGFQSVPKFYGFVPSEQANRTLTEHKQIFQECAYSSETLTHGQDSHRIQLVGLFYLIKQCIIKLTAEKTHQDFLTYIVKKDLFKKLL